MASLRFGYAEEEPNKPGTTGEQDVNHEDKHEDRMQRRWAEQLTIGVIAIGFGSLLMVVSVPPFPWLVVLGVFITVDALLAG